jgi:hypothetical protein
MTLDPREKRSLRTSKLDVECLGERIAPAVYQTGIAHQLALKLGSQSQLETLLKEFEQNGDKAHIIVGKKMSLGMHFITSSINHKAPVKPVPVFPVVPPGPVNEPFGAVSLNLIKAPVRPVPVVPVVPTGPVNQPFGALSLKIGNGPVKPVQNPPSPANPPVNQPYSLVTLASPNSGTPANSGALPDNVSAALNTIYQQYENDPATFSGVAPSTDGANLVVVNGNEVGIQVRDSSPAEFQSLTAMLNSAGMTISSSSATYGLVVGMLPISELLAVAQFSQAISVTPEYSATVN